MKRSSPVSWVTRKNCARHDRGSCQSQFGCCDQHDESEHAAEERRLESCGTEARTDAPAASHAG